MPAFISLALTYFFVVVLARAVMPEAWKAIRPGSCDLCMTWWTFFTHRFLFQILAALEFQPKSEWWPMTTTTALPAAGLCLLMLALLRKWNGPDVPPPEIPS
jgi:hypothetical protein